MSAGNDPLDHVVQHRLAGQEADLGPLTPDGVVTLMSDHVFMLLLAGLLLMATLPLLVRRRAGRGDIDVMVPTGSANFLEVICQYLRTEVAEPALGEHTDRFITFIWSVFFFVLTVNLLGIVPIAPVSTLFGTHLGGTATGNIWVTGTLALITLGMVVVNGLRIGGTAYLAHFGPALVAGAPFVARLLLTPLMVVVELIGLIAKIAALAIRLFANMIAGHILLAVLVSFILGAWASMGTGGGLLIAVPVVIGSVAITFLEIFVAFLQAFIFTFLSTLFIGMAVDIDHHHDEDHGPEGEEGHHGEELLELS